MTEKPALVPSPDVTRHSKMGASIGISSLRNVCLVHPPENARRDASSGPRSVAREETGDEMFASAAVRYVRDTDCIDREHPYGSDTLWDDLNGGGGGEQQIVEKEAVAAKAVTETAVAEHEKIDQGVDGKEDGIDDDQGPAENFNSGVAFDSMLTASAVQGT
jgi:hypothetical protein